MVWKEKHRLSTNAWPTCCLWNVTCPIVPSWVGWDASCLRNPQIWGLREQILHALCHQRLLRHSPRLLWGVCATGILTVSHQEQNKSILFPKLDILQKKIVVFLPLLIYTTVVFLIKGLAPLINKQKKWRKKIICRIQHNSYCMVYFGPKWSHKRSQSYLLQKNFPRGACSQTPYILHKIIIQLP